MTTSSDKASTYAHQMWYLIRYVMPVVTPHEWAVICWISQRTLAFSKLSEVIPERHFLEGMSWDGERHIARVNFSESTLKRAIASLVEKNFLIKKSQQRNPNTVYRLNFAGFTENPGWVHREPTKYNCLERKNNISREQAPARGFEENVMSSDPMEALRAAAAGASAKTAAARQAKKGKQTPGSYQAIFKDAFLLHFPTETWFSWTVATMSAFAKALDRGVPLEQRQPFIEYIVEHWSSIVTTGVFKRWASGSPVPAMGLIISHVGDFYRAYQEHVDPNRKVAARIAAAPKRDVNVYTPAPDNAELEKLRNENAALKKTVAAVRGEAALQKRAVIKQRILNRPKSSEDFGPWIDPK